MKRSQTETPDTLDPELDAGNEEFDFSDAPRPGRNELFERAQGQFHEVKDAEDRARSDSRPLESGPRQRSGADV